MRSALSHLYLLALWFAAGVLNFLACREHMGRDEHYNVNGK